ncbi:MAG: glycosyltransferase [Chitinophagaceae bacterium]|nr:glycosyltransferase [Chitinophagaceae bacterium]
MSQSVSFSIIIPTYNSAATIEACLESIVIQSCTDWEVLIMDAISTDETIHLSETIAKTDRRIRIFSEKDQGIYDAMNKGIAKAKGQWIYFMGSDDRLFDETVLKKIKNFAEQNSTVSIFYGDVYSSRFNGRYAGSFTAEKLYEQNICHQAIFLKQDVFNIIGMFDLKFKSWADYEHNIRWFLNRGLQKKFIDIVVAEYADGGFSSGTPDVLLTEKKAELFLYYRMEKFDPFFRAMLLLSAAIQKKNKQQWLLFCWYKLQFYYFSSAARLKTITAKR